jgi:hypothetical protein
VTVAEQILAVVVATPGITTNVLCKQVKVRKADVLAELERLRQNGLLRLERGLRASKSWYVVAGRGNQFLTGSREIGETSSTAEVDGDR